MKKLLSLFVLMFIVFGISIFKLSAKLDSKLGYSKLVDDGGGSETPVNVDPFEGLTSFNESITSVVDVDEDHYQSKWLLTMKVYYGSRELTNVPIKQLFRNLDITFPATITYQQSEQLSTYYSFTESLTLGITQSLKVKAGPPFISGEAELGLNLSSTSSWQWSNTKLTTSVITEVITISNPSEYGIYSYYLFAYKAKAQKYEVTAHHYERNEKSEKNGSQENWRWEDWTEVVDDASSAVYYICTPSNINPSNFSLKRERHATFAEYYEKYAKYLV
jgi:hypothetical protein